jgi:hypothetical protein
MWKRSSERWVWMSSEMLPIYITVGAFLVLGAVAWGRDLLGKNFKRSQRTLLEHKREAWKR